jgi:hypothetical protein
MESILPTGMVSPSLLSRVSILEEASEVITIVLLVVVDGSGWVWVGLRMMKRRKIKCGAKRFDDSNKVLTKGHL